MFSGDPIGQGLIGSLSHPGGNVTGVSLLAQTLEAKRLELLRDALPKAHRIAALLDSFQLRVAALRQEISEAAANAGVEVLFFETAGPEDYGRAFAAIRAARPGQCLMFGRLRRKKALKRSSSSKKRSRLIPNTP
jgi:putative ABC transport system substrate-binding protein